MTFTRLWPLWVTVQDNFHPDMTFTVDCARRLSPSYDLCEWLCKTTFTRIWPFRLTVQDDFHPDMTFRLTAQDDYHPDVTFTVDCARQLLPGYDLCGWLCKTTFHRIWPMRLTVQDNFHPDMTFAADCARWLSSRHDFRKWLCISFVPIWSLWLTALNWWCLVHLSLDISRNNVCIWNKLLKKSVTLVLVLSLIHISEPTRRA